jgi:hypothetical protein
MRVDFLSPAQAELVEAIDYYNSKKAGLGSEFAEEVQRTIHRISQSPEAWAPLSKRTRRCRTQRFPYGVIYQLRGNSILVVAIMHMHRDPQGWKTRLSKQDR